jgi:hypothetical protein
LPLLQAAPLKEASRYVYIFAAGPQDASTGEAFTLAIQSVEFNPPLVAMHRH